MLPFLRLGPLMVQLPGLVLLLGVWLGLSLSEKVGRRLDIRSNLIYNLVFLGLLSGVIGARLAYAIRYIRIYLENPLGLLSLSSDTLAVTEGFLIALLVMVAYAQHKNMPLKPTLDALAPGLALYMIFFGLAHLLSGNAYGATSGLPWSIYLWNEYRHPSQVYEILASLGIFYLVWKRSTRNDGLGLNFLWVIAMSAGARLFLETFRGDSVIWPGGLRAAQVVSLAVMLVALWFVPDWRQPEELE
jgi:phosphatidylglycerol:prolipoprotein diacylglycerol transferase